MGLTNKTSAALGASFGNPNTRKKAERDLRTTQRESINKIRKNALKFSGFLDRPRMSGLDYIRTRKSRPNVSDGVRGLTKMQRKDTRIEGQFSGQRNLPIGYKNALNTKPISAKVPAPFTHVKTPAINPASLFKGALRG